MEEYYKNLSLEDLPNEEWRDVVGFEGYMVSNLGRVKSLDRIVEFKASQGKKPYSRIVKGCILHQWCNSRGYLSVPLYKPGTRKRFFVHRLVAMAFLGDSGDKEVNHIDKRPQNNCISNLEYMSHKENMAYSIDEFHDAVYKKCYMYDCNGFFVREYSSISEAAKDNGLKSPTIVGSCTLMRKKGHNVHFRYYKVDKIEIPNRYYYKVSMQDKEGNQIRLFENVDEAATFLGVEKNTVVCTCIGRQKTCKGYILRYIK